MTLALHRMAEIPVGIEANYLTSGEACFAREFFTSLSAVSPASGQLRFTMFTARKTETSTQVRLWSGSTAAAATPTLCRVGLWTVAADGTLTLVASTANDVTMFAAANTGYTRLWTTPYAKVMGQRYAIGPLIVSATTMPTLGGHTVGSATTAATLAPIMSASLTGQTDLPASVAAGSLGLSGQRPYLELLP